MTLYDSFYNGTTTLFFIRIDGYPDPEEQTYKEITREGMGGRAYRMEGIRGNEFTLRTVVDVTGDANATSTANGYKSFQLAALPVSIFYVNGTVEFDNYYVLDVKIEKPVPVRTGIGGINGGTRLLYATWKFVYGST